MKCYRCQIEIQENMQFCPGCGAVLQVTDSLIHRACHKDEAALEQLFYMTRQQVYFIVRTMVWDEETALDLIEDIYVKMFRSLTQLKNPAGFDRWVRKMTLTETAAWIKKQQPMILQGLSAAANQGSELSDDRYYLELPQCDLTQEQIEIYIEEVLRTLSAGQRLFAGLYYGQRMSINEIAEIFTVSEDAVREKLSEMRKQLAMCVEAGGRAKTKDLTMPEYLMWLYTGLKAHSAECMSEVILHDVQKKAGDKKGKKAAKAVGVAAMAVAGESVGEVAKEGLKATITRIIAGLTATAVIGGGTGAAVKTYQENKAEEKLSGVQIQQDISTEIIQKDSVPESLESENSGDIVCDPHYISDISELDAETVKEIIGVLEKTYQDQVDGFVGIPLKDESHDWSFPKGDIASVSDMQIGGSGYFAKESGSTGEEGNLLFVNCYITLNDVCMYEADGSVNTVTFEDAVGTFKLTDLYMEEDGTVIYGDFIDFYGFYVTGELLEDEWIRTLENQYEITEIDFK